MSALGELILPALAALGLTALGVAWLALVDRLVKAAVAGNGGYGRAVAAPFRSGLRLLFKEFRSTERPDRALWLAAPILLNALVLAALVVMPLSPGAVGADLSVGVVFFTAMFRPGDGGRVRRRLGTEFQVSDLCRVSLHRADAGL